MTDILISKLSKAIVFDGFDCGDESLNSYIKQFASQDVKRKLAVVYVAINNKEILGFYSLSASSITADSLPQNIQKKLPKYPVPVALIGRLAIDKKHQGSGIGGILLVDAIKRIAKTAEYLGINSIIVDAKNQKAARFYQHYGFIKLQEKHNRLFMPIQTAMTLYDIVQP